MAGKEIGPTKPIAKDDWPPSDIMEFWEDPKNRDLIINAKPLECWFEEKKSQCATSTTGYAPEDFTPEDFTPTASLAEFSPTGDTPGQSTSSASSAPSPQQHVPNDCLTKYPFQSVGKLFWLIPTTRTILYHSTAFYIGDEKIMTVAHHFDKDTIKGYPVPPNAVIFVPAMSDKEDIYGVNYGYYKLDHHCIHRNHNKYTFSPKYDICIAKIIDGRRPVGGTKENPTEFELIQIVPPNPLANYGLAQLKSIPRLPYPQPYEDMRKCTVLGYGSTSLTTPVIEDTTGKMMIFNIEKVCVTLYNDMHGIVTMKPSVWKGASGGPWLNGNNTAIGIQSAGYGKSNITFSPLWTEYLLSDYPFE